MDIKILGVAGGGGVMLYPFKKYLIGNIEPRTAYKTPDEIQWKLNFDKIPLWRDYELSNFVIDKIPTGNIDVIIGQPKCGHSSILALSRAKKFGDGKADKTIALFISGVKSLKPKFFLFENLQALFNSFPEKEFDELLSEYKLVKHLVSVAAFGNSQVGRKRLVIVGIRKDIKWANASSFKLPKQESINIKQVAELEKLLTRPDANLFHIREPDDMVITMERDFKRLNLKQIRNIWNEDGNKHKKSWDARTTGKGRMLTLPGVYRNLPNQTPRTVLKNHRQFNSKGYIMSPRELAIIQGIPNEFKLYYDPSKLTYCLNKARVTVTMSPPYQVGEWFYKRLIKVYKKRDLEK